MVSAGSFTMIKVLFLLDSISLYYNKLTSTHPYCFKGCQFTVAFLYMLIGLFFSFSSAGEREAIVKSGDTEGLLVTNHQFEYAQNFV